MTVLSSRSVLSPFFFALSPPLSLSLFPSVCLTQFVVSTLNYLLQFNGDRTILPKNYNSNKNFVSRICIHKISMIFLNFHHKHFITFCWKLRKFTILFVWTSIIESPSYLALFSHTPYPSTPPLLFNLNPFHYPLL